MLSAFFNIIFLILIALIWALPLLTLGVNLAILEILFSYLLKVFGIDYKLFIGHSLIEKALDFPFCD